jgi:hypothetical protein
MRRNRFPPQPAQPPGLIERRINLSAIEGELVKSAVAEHNTARATADGALAQRLAPIRAEHKLGEGVRADFKPTTDGKSIVMVVFEEAK